MRTARVLILGSLASAALSGCAPQRDVAVATAPAPHELPDPAYAERVIPANIQVEGAADLPRRPLVPEFVEPQLTAEERRALGEREEVIEFLKYELPGRFARRNVGSWLAGPAVSVHGQAIATTATTPATRRYGHLDADGPPAVQADFFGVSISAQDSSGKTPVAGVGNREGIHVETGQRKDIARPKQHVEP